MSNFFLAPLIAAVIARSSAKLYKCSRQNDLPAYKTKNHSISTRIHTEYTSYSPDCFHDLQFERAMGEECCLLGFGSIVELRSVIRMILYCQTGNSRD